MNDVPLVNCSLCYDVSLVESYFSCLLNTGTVFRVIHQNIRSYRKNFDEFLVLLQEQAEREAALQQIPVPNVRLLFTCPEGLDSTRYNVPQSNEVCAVVTLNADQSFPDNPLIIRQRGKSVQIMKNIDKHAEPLTYPLFFPKGTFGFSPGMLLREGYPSRGHITRLELARYRIAFRPHLTQCISLDETIRGYDLRNLKFNALHFGGRLFQQYLVDTYIRIEYVRIQWIKLNQKKILADSYTSVTNYLNEIAQKNNAVLGEKIILPSSFPGTKYILIIFIMGDNYCVYNKIKQLITKPNFTDETLTRPEIGFPRTK